MRVRIRRFGGAHPFRVVGQTHDLGAKKTAKGAVKDAQ
jgi:hypothetical protein